MPLLTTTIGAYPKPDYVEALRVLGDQGEAVFVRATREVVLDQVDAGIDIPTDGEVRRENYIHYHCRHLDGIDFDKLTTVDIRNGAYADARLPTITAPVRARESFLTHDLRIAQSFTDRSIKITMPGPMTISGTVADKFYDAVAIRPGKIDRSPCGARRLPAFRNPAGGAGMTSTAEYRVTPSAGPAYTACPPAVSVTVNSPSASPGPRQRSGKSPTIRHCA